MEKEKEIKTIYDLAMHETMLVLGSIDGVKETEKKIEVTRVPGGWIYAFEFPGFRQAPTVFVPYVTEGPLSSKKIK